MPRERDPNRDRAFEIWKASNGQIDLVEIAAQLGTSPGTIRGWKSKDQWEQRLNGTLPSKKRNAPKAKERSEPKAPPREPPIIEVDDDSGLTDKERIFVMEYMRDFNATRAAIVCGYKKSIASTEGWRMLRKPHVQAEIKRQKEERITEIGLDVQRVILEWMKIAFADISDVVHFGNEDVPLYTKKGTPILNEDGSHATQKVSFVELKNDHELDGSVISEVKQGRDGVGIKLHDKTKALKELEKYLGFMTEEDKLKLAKLRAEVKAAEGAEEETPDDGFLDALHGKAAEVWGDGEPDDEET